MKQEIFKVQVSIASSDESGQVLIYNKSRSSQGVFPLNKDIKKMMNGEFKKFFYGTHLPSDEIRIIKETDWQDW